MIMLLLENVLIFTFTIIFVATWFVMGWNVYCLLYIDLKERMSERPAKTIGLNESLLLHNEKWLKYRSLNSRDVLCLECCA
jgi:hypothetical protein